MQKFKMIFCLFIVVLIFSADLHATYTDYGNTDETGVTADCANCWAVSIEYAANILNSFEDAYQGQVANFACERWNDILCDFNKCDESHPECFTAEEILENPAVNNYLEWGICRESVEAIMEGTYGMGFSINSISGAVSKDDLYTTYCTNDKDYCYLIYLTVGIDHVVAISGIRVYDDNLDDLYLYTNDTYNNPAYNPLFFTYEQVIDRDWFYTTEATSWWPSEEWRQNNTLAFLFYFTPYLDGSGVTVDFKTTLEKDTSHFLLQRSPEGLDAFATIDTMQAQGAETEYSYTDAEGTGSDFYRLMEVENNGTQHLLEFSRVFDQAPDFEYTGTTTERRDIDSIRDETESILQQKRKLLGLPAAPFSEGYQWLAIYPDSFASDVADLTSWRNLNGLSTHGISTDRGKQQLREYKGLYSGCVGRAGR